MVKFAYAIGRIRSLETQLLDASHLLRLTEAPDQDSAFLILRENPFHAAEIDKLEHSFDFEALLRQELSSTKALLDSLAPGEESLAAMWLKYSDLSLGDYLVQLEKTAGRVQSPLFRRYVLAYATLNRLKLSLLKEKSDPDQIIEHYRFTAFARPVTAGLEEYRRSGSLFALERETDNHLFSIMKEAKYLTFGIEPLLGFLFAREQEQKMIRLIMTAKLQKIPSQLIKERLIYV
ncbi:MAG: V-type ATPase subunit [Candidatus Margulisiibacteriota bacterium]|jgi:vacuolar-type H+-ATPase subunit C/Vma6